MDLLDDANAMGPDLARLRAEVHRDPEVGLSLPRTQNRILSALESLPVDVTLGESSTSVTAVLEGTAPGTPESDVPSVLLRADMDALPVEEAVDVPYRSERPGVMHACGHDMHVAMLVGAAQLLSAHRDHLKGNVVFMFQPGEEGWDGAQHMVDEGVLTAAGRQVDAAYALHVFSSLTQHGVFSHKGGLVLSASDELHVTVRGVGGHGSMPHRCKDPITVAAEMVQALNTMVTKRFDSFDPVVLNVGLFQAGTKANVIPDTVHFEATVRCYSPETRELLRKLTVQLLEGIAHAYGVDVDAEYVDQYPVTVNDEAEAAFAASTATELFGESRNLHLPRPLNGSEDFSRVLSKVPGAFIGLGAMPPGADPRTAPYNHSAHATFDSSVLPAGTALNAEIAVRRLDQLASK
ncbi:M20 family metallopeptidase [Streptomyces sp. NPDC102364]|uniref:M20 metallopeptidase family protein n=1 Tax=Streptomyces sp. NPDC102364 TaxID=3366161 RepID=UPI003830635F